MKRLLEARGMSVEQGRMFVHDRIECRAVARAMYTTTK